MRTFSNFNNSVLGNSQEMLKEVIQVERKLDNTVQ